MAFKWSPFDRSRQPKVWKIGQYTLNRSLMIPIIAFLLILLYSTVSFVIYHYNPIKTIPAAQVSMDNSFSTTGYFLRQEEVVDVSAGDTVEYNYSNGDKVAEGSALVTQYTDEEALAASRELKSMKDNIEQLETLRSVSSMTSNSSLMNQKIIEQLNAICTEVESGSLRQITAMTYELRQLCLKSGTVASNDGDIEQEIADLKKKTADLEARLSGKKTDVMAPCSGYFCESADGYENVFTPDVINDLTLKSLSKLAGKKPEKVSGKGKIVSGYAWYFAAKVTDADAENVSLNSRVILHFPQVSQNLHATVVSIRDDLDSDDTLVIFQSQDMTENLISMRKQVATVVVGSYSGLKVPKSAVRMAEDDKMGVYVLSSTVASYKNIIPIFEGEDFYIVEQNVMGNDSLVVDDDIIVEAKDVNDKKVMK